MDRTGTIATGQSERCVNGGRDPSAPGERGRRDAKGAWRRWSLPDKAGRPFIDDITLLPGTKRPVAMGTDLDLSANGIMVVLK